MKASHINNRIFSFILILIMFISSGSSTLAQNPDDAPEQEGQLNSPVVAQVYYFNTESLTKIATYLDIWEVNHVAGYLVAMISPEQYASLQQEGYRIVIDQEKTDLLYQLNIPLPGQSVDSIPGYPCYRTVEEDYSSMQDIATNFPGIAELIDIGDSWDKLTDGGPVGYEIYALRLSNESFGTIDDKPTFFLMAEIHAREYVTAETAMRYGEYLASNYGIDPDITWLLDYFRIYIVTMTNPDGRKFAEQGLYWRKNTNNIAGGGCGYPNYGIDLNRNHGFHWGGASSYPCDETYQGPVPVSEPETQAIQNYVMTLLPDQRGPGDNDPAPVDTTGTLISLHSYSQLVLWPWGWTYGQAPNNTQMQTLGRHLAYFNNYTPQQAVDLYPTTGTSDDWSYGELGIASYTFEMGTNFFQGCTSFENTIYPNNMTALLYAVKTARRPYINPAGPDTLNVAVAPNSIPGGTPVLLTANANDTRFNNSNGSEPTQNIAEARYSIDNPSWITGTVTLAMTASDGYFNNPIENIQATIETGGLSEGRHTIFVESKDADGNWGVTSAVFLDITTPAYGVMLTPESSTVQADPGVIVTFPMQVNNIGMNPDTYDISVISLWEYSAPATIGPIAAGGNATFDFQVTVPITATHGESDIATVTATSQFNPDVSDSSSLTTVANYFDLLLSPSTAEDNGYPGGQVGYILQITNLGNTVDTFNLQSTNVWNVTLPPTSGPLNPGASVDFDVIVDVPISAVPGDYDIAVITATSQGDGSKTQTSTLTTTTVQMGPFVDPANDEASGDPGTQVIYSLQLNNYNFVADTFTVSVESTWVMDYPFSVGPIPADGSAIVEIIVNVPADADGSASDSAVVTFTSSDPELPSASATLITSANNIFNFQAVAEADTLIGYGRGSTVEYIIQVTNTGNITDTYNIHVLSSIWTVEIPENVGPLGRGESLNVSIFVHVPFDIVMGDSNEAIIAFASQGNPLEGHQVYLHTDTFWYSNFLPISQRQ